MAATNHQRKKQFQPSIASYFEKQPGNGSSPPLPAETQASLINVGMRVRKSVPEGYKTHKTVIRKLESTVTTTTTLSQPSLERWNSRELTPFSGIHKVGGYAQQAHCSSSAPALLSKASFDSVPSLTASQSTTSSATSFANDEPSTRKPSYEEEMEESMDMFFDEMEQEEEDEIAARRIAQPKAYSRRQRMLDVLDRAGDFSDAHFLRPITDSEMNEGYA